MPSFTIHAIDASLESRLSERASLAGISKNQLIKDLLAQATGLPTQTGYVNDYQEFCGAWSVAESQEFAATQRENSQIDPADWQ